MKKPIIVSLTVVTLLLAAAVGYARYRGRLLSPPAEASLTSDGLNVTVSYSRPSARGRLIFGHAEQNAVQPYSEYWRLGANKATEITFSDDVIFNGNIVKAGAYNMYAFPGEDAFEIALNTELGAWGMFKPDFSKEVIRTRVSVEKIKSFVEQYTITLKPSSTGMSMVVEWSDTKLVVPIRHYRNVLDAAEQ